MKPMMIKMEWTTPKSSSRNENDVKSSQLYSTPSDVLKHFELAWNNDKEVLEICLATLRSTHQSLTNVHNNPSSLFFFEVLSGLPLKF